MRFSTRNLWHGLQDAHTQSKRGLIFGHFYPSIENVVIEPFSRAIKWTQSCSVHPSISISFHVTLAFVCVSSCAHRHYIPDGKSMHIGIHSAFEQRKFGLMPYDNKNDIREIKIGEIGNGKDAMQQWYDMIWVHSVEVCCCCYCYCCCGCKEWTFMRFVGEKCEMTVNFRRVCLAVQSKYRAQLNTEQIYDTTHIHRHDISEWKSISNFVKCLFQCILNLFHGCNAFITFTNFTISISLIIVDFHSNLYGAQTHTHTLFTVFGVEIHWLGSRLRVIFSKLIK